MRIAYIFRTADASFSVTVSVVPSISRSSQRPILTHHTSTHNLLNPHLTPLPISLTPTPTHLTPAPLTPTKTTNHTQGQHTPSINPINKNPHPPPRIRIRQTLRIHQLPPKRIRDHDDDSQGVGSAVKVCGVGGSVCRVGRGIVWGFGVGGWKGGGDYIEG